jgi:hypothetical protein
VKAVGEVVQVGLGHVDAERPDLGVVVHGGSFPGVVRPRGTLLPIAEQ